MSNPKKNAHSCHSRTFSTKILPNNNGEWDYMEEVVASNTNPAGNSLLNVSAQHKDTIQQQWGMGLHGGGNGVNF
eukprot:2352261-Ditylum_brightwellii.AAC.1